VRQQSEVLYRVSDDVPYSAVLRRNDLQPKNPDVYNQAMMLAAERRRKIAELVAQTGAVKTDELARLFSVSPATIRQDLRYLDSKGLIVRTHGGGISVGQSLLEAPHTEKSRKGLAFKQRIGKKAAELVKSDSAVFIGPGTTTIQMLPHLSKKEGIRIFTNGLNIAVEAAKLPHTELYIVGGLLRRMSLATIGMPAEQFLENFFFDQLFLGAHSVSISLGICEPDIAEAKLYRLVINSSHMRVVLADHTKIQKFSSVKVADLSEFDALITDRDIEQEYIDAIKSTGIELILA